MLNQKFILSLFDGDGIKIITVKDVTVVIEFKIPNRSVTSERITQ